MAELPTDVRQCGHEGGRCATLRRDVGRPAPTSGGTPAPAATAGSPGPARTPTCGSGSPARRPPGAWTSSTTGPATSGPGGATPTRDGPGRRPGSHLDSVPDGGAFDGPLGVVSALRRASTAARARVRPGPAARRRRVRRRGGRPVRRGLRRVAAAHRRARRRPGPRARRRRRGHDGRGAARAGPRPRRARPRRGGAAPDRRRSSSCTSSRAGRCDDRRAGRRSAPRSGRTAAGGSSFAGEADHAGTTRLADRRDPMLAFAPRCSPRAAAAERHGALATCGKVGVAPNGVNAIPSRVTAWLDARGPRRRRPCGAVVGARWRGRRRGARGHRPRGVVDRTGRRSTRRCATGWPALLGDAPRLADRRRPRRRDPRRGRRARRRCCSSATRPGVSHAPAEHAERADCLAGVDALAGGRWPTWPGWTRDARAGRARLLPGGLARDVSFDGRRRPVHRRRPPAPPPATRARLPGRRRCPASPTPTPTPSTGRCAGAPTTRGGTFWTWRERMYAVAARLDPDSYLALARAAFAELALAGVTGVGEFHYLHHGPDGSPVRRPERHGRGAGAGRRRGRHPAHPARHLLPHRRRRTAARSRACSGGSATATPTRGRRGSPRCGDGPGLRIGAAATRCGRYRGRRCPSSAEAARRPPAARPPVRAARRERRVPGRLRAHPDRAARRRGRCSARPPRPCTRRT